MEESRISIKKNYGYQVMYQIVLVLTVVITTPYTSRVFGSEGIGIQSYTASVVSYFLLFAMLGTASYGQREIARARDDKEKYSRLFWEIELVSVIATLICMVVWCVFLFFVKRYKVYYIVQTISILAVMFDISWFFSGFENFRSVILRNCAVKLIGIAALFLFIRGKDDLLLYIFILALTTFLSNLSMWLSLKKYLVRVELRGLRLMHHFKETWIYFIPTIATSVYTTLDKTMIGMTTKDMRQSGYYQQATELVKMCMSMILVLHTTVSARMSYLFTKGQMDSAKEILESVLKMTLFAAIPLAFGIAGIAENFVVWFYGAEYFPVAKLVWCLSGLIVVISISHCFGALFYTPIGQRSRSSKAIVAGACMNVLLNAVMIPLWGAKGAAISSLLAELVVTALYLKMSHYFYSSLRLLPLIWKWFIAGGVMFLVVRWIGKLYEKNIYCTILQIGCGILVYFIVLFILRDRYLKGEINESWKMLR